MPLSVLPPYTATTVSNDDPQASIRASPDCGAVHVNHTDRFAATQVEWTGSASCALASTFDPVAATPEASVAACSKSSLAGGSAPAIWGAQSARTSTTRATVDDRIAPVSRRRRARQPRGKKTNKAG